MMSVGMMNVIKICKTECDGSKIYFVNVKHGSYLRIIKKIEFYDTKVMANISQKRNKRN